MTWDITELIYSWWIYLWLMWIRPTIKGFLRRTTGLCELQRVSYATQGACSDRCLQIENSLLLSRSVVIRRVRDRLIFQTSEDGRRQKQHQQQNQKCPSSHSIDSTASSPPRTTSTTTTTSGDPDHFEDAQLIEYAVEAICLDKDIKESIHPEFVASLRTSLTQLYYFKKVIEDAEDLRTTTFSHLDGDHCNLLVRLWNNLKPDRQIETISDCNEWSQIGFQQDKDPSSDFRGMGLLSLVQMLFLSEEHPSSARSMLVTSSHPQIGYSFAITGINMTHLVLSLMRDGSLKSHFFNQQTPHSPQIWLEDLNKAYAYIFIAFNQFWVKSDPINVMEFGVIREKFVSRLKSHLRESDSGDLFKWWCPVVDSV